MNIIFLDFNGVLDNYDNWDQIDSNHLQRLKAITTSTNSKIVLTASIKNSYFRSRILSSKLKYLVDTITGCGIEVVDMVPYIYNATREEEIIAYLNSNPEVLNFCIIDDEDEFTNINIRQHLVKLPHQMWENGNGLDNEKYVDEAIKIIQGNRPNILQKQI